MKKKTKTLIFIEHKVILFNEFTGTGLKKNLNTEKVAQPDLAEYKNNFQMRFQSMGYSEVAIFNIS